MIELCSNEKCNGCTACENICPKSAISMKSDEHGFLHPEIDKKLCVECGLCKKVCSYENPLQYENTYNKVFAVWDKNLEERRKATSGGAFILIAKKFIDKSGVVYGAAFDDKFEVRHIRASVLEEVVRLRGSKYVQSSMGNIYKQVKTDLIDGKQVLFSGTPCQISGLRNFLSKEYDNLWCIDILCHGVPSPKVFRDYKEYRKRKAGKEIKSINFRYKKPCWSVFSMKIDYVDGSTCVESKFKDPFLYFFLVRGGDLTIRESCHNCRFTSVKREGDLTLADFWNYEAKKYRQRGSENGVGMVKVNTAKGELLLGTILDDIYCEECDMEMAHKSNQSFSMPWKRPDMKDMFWKDYNKLSFEEMVIKYCVDAREDEERAKRIVFVKAHKYWLPFKVRDFLKKRKNNE